MILLLKTDQPQAEVWLYDDKKQIAHKAWQAHRELSDTLLLVIKALLDTQGRDWSDIAGVGVFAGPGSFTGLRISHSAANALAYSLQISIVSASGQDWQVDCFEQLKAATEVGQIIAPDYGRPARITKPRK